MTRLLRLDDRRARDAAAVGAKAARLAVARAGGFPVPDGVVVPIAEAAPVVERAAAAGPGSARRAALGVVPDPALLAELRAAAAGLGSPLIVRSSGAQEDAAWAGAFASLAGVGPEDLATALRSCWASAFAPDPLGRWERSGAPIAALGIALLVQRELRPRRGGTAEALEDGSVRVVATDGSIAALLSGWEPGTTTVVPPGGGDGVAALARDLHRATGDAVIEWAEEGGELYLLQCRPAVPVAPAGPAPAPAVSPAARDPLALRVARLAAAYRGGPGERLVLPWAAGLAALPPAAAGPADPERLVAEAWEAPPEQARAEAEQTFARLRGADPEPALDRLRRLRPVDPWLAGRARGQVERLPDRPARAGVLRWEPFLHEVAHAHGRSHPGEGIVDGVGAGAARLVAAGSTPSGPGRVLVVDRPVPGIAPLLWEASALVVRSGGRGAHLFEVAGSLGVPTVAAAAGVAVRDGDLVAVDGAAGSIWHCRGEDSP